MKKPEVTIIPVPYEATASGSKGTANGPKAIIKELNMQIEDYDRIIKKITLEQVDIKIQEELKVTNLKPEEMVEKVEETIKENNDFPITLGGDHGVSIGAIKALKEKHKDLTIVQIDAHLDLRDSSSDYEIENPSKFAHCCVMRRARDFGCSTVQVGIRVKYSKEEEYIEKEKIQNKIFECPLNKTVGEIINEIDSEKVYLTIDVDGFDPSQMPGTGTPVQGGLEWHSTIQLIKKIFETKDVVGADIVEVSPLPNNHLTEYGAAQLLYHIIGFKYNKILK